MKSLLSRLMAKCFAFLFRLSYHLDLLPFCPLHGVNRGGSIGRFYVDEWVKRHAKEVRGNVLEFGGETYRKWFSPEGICSYDVIDIVDRSGVTRLSDIQSCPEIPDASYDAVICTQVLEHVKDPRKAISEIIRILKKGGVLILTVPFNGALHASPDDFWRFSPSGLRALLEGCPFQDSKMELGGNIYSSSMYHVGLGMADVSQAMLKSKEDTEPLNLLFFGRLTA